MLVLGLYVIKYAYSSVVFQISIQLILFCFLGDKNGRTLIIIVIIATKHNPMAAGHNSDSADKPKGYVFYALKKLGILSLRKTFFASLNYKKYIGKTIP